MPAVNTYPSAPVRQYPLVPDVPLPGASRPFTMGRGQSDAGFDLRPCPCGARMPLQVRLHLRSRTRPVFEGRWCCSGACLEARVATAVRRETKREPVRRTHEHRIPLGLLLLSTGVISQEDLRRALKVQQGTGKRIGEVLTTECGVPERKVTEALATQWSCPMWNVAGTRLAGMAAVAPRAILQRTGTLPLRLVRGTDQSERAIGPEHRLAVAFTEAIDPQAVFGLRWMHDVAVDAGVAPKTQWAEAHTHVLSASGVPAEEMDCASLADMENSIIRTLKRLQPVESRWARVHEFFWLRLWLEPAALAGGPQQTEDVADFVYRMPSALAAAAAW